MAMIFIDTNVYLAFYQGSKDPLKIFTEIEKYHSSLVLTTQTVDEFFRNRRACLRDLIARVKTFTPEIPRTPIVDGLKEIADLHNLAKSTNEVISKIRDHLQAYLDDDAKDPVFLAFQKICDNVTSYAAGKDEIALAKERKALGNPPNSPSKQTIGDEVIWETLLASVKGDLIIVSRDNTFLHNIPILRAEYKRKTGHELTITERVTQALNQVGETSEELVKAENELAGASWYENLTKRVADITEYESEARKIDPSIGSFGANGQYSGRQIRKSLIRFRALIDGGEPLTIDQSTIINRVDEMIADWTNWPEENAKKLDVLRMIKNIAVSLGKM